MQVELATPTDPRALALLDKYRRRGGNDDAAPFRSGNVLAWDLITRGPVTTQSLPFAVRGVFAVLPEPWRVHLDPTFDAERADESFTVVELGASVERLVGLMALHHGMVCSVAREPEAREDLAVLRDWSGPRTFALRGAGVFRVGACWSFTELWLSSERAALFVFLSVD